MSQGMLEIAEKRAKAKLGWYIHAAVYALVNLMQITVSLLTWHWEWSVLGAMGWGLGLAIHGLVVFGIASGLQQQLLEQELEQMGRP